VSTLALISEFSERGIRVRPNGADVTVSPKRALTPELLKRIKREKAVLLRELEKVRKQAGKDWEAIANDPKQLKAFYELLMISEMRERGQIPAHYTSTTTCNHCGTVPIFEGCLPEVLGCPWCFNRHKGLPIPRPQDCK